MAASGKYKSILIRSGDSAEIARLSAILEKAGYDVVTDQGPGAPDTESAAITLSLEEDAAAGSVVPDGGAGKIFRQWPAMRDWIDSWFPADRKTPDEAADGEEGGCFLLLNLDHFKRVRAFVGDHTATAILREVAIRIASTVQAHIRDLPGGQAGEEVVQVCHMGGDEFAVAIRGHAEGVEAAGLARSLLIAVSRHYESIAPQIYLTGRVGIALAPEDGVNAQTLMRNVASIIHHEERSGRNSYRFYTKGLTATAHKRLELEGALGQAVSEGALEVYYQPQASLLTGRIHGAEALARWRHKGNLLPADLFIAAAEDVGLITEIGNRVLAAACREVKQLHDQGFDQLEVSINISPYQLHGLSMLEVVEKALSESGLDPRFLVLEVTESLMLSDVERTLEIFGALRKKGIHLALDDFGTGYSSLSYLKSLTIDRLKLDRSFVEGLPGDAGDRAVTEAIIRMARALDLQVTAEGVETVGQREFLSSLGCDHYQGFLLAKPLPAAAFEAFLADRKAAAQPKS